MKWPRHGGRLDSPDVQVAAGVVAGLLGALFVLVPETDAVPDSVEGWAGSIVAALLGAGGMLVIWRLPRSTRRPEASDASMRLREAPAPPQPPPALPPRLRNLVDHLVLTGVPHYVRKPCHQGPLATELDLSAPSDAMEALEDALRLHRYHRLRAPGRGPHRFFLSYTQGRWYKVDVKLGGSPHEAGPFFPRKLFDAWLRRMPVGIRRLGPVVVLRGPGRAAFDLAARLASDLPVAASIHGDARTSSGPVGWGRGWAFLAAQVRAWRGNVVLYPMECDDRRGAATPAARSADAVFSVGQDGAEACLPGAAHEVWRALSSRRGWGEGESVAPGQARRSP